MDLPADLPLIVQIGGGETQLQGLVRVTRSARGNVHRDVLFYAGTHTYANGDGTFSQIEDYHANGVAIPTPAPDGSGKLDASSRPYIAAYGVSSDASKLAVALCVRGLCGGGPVTVGSDAILYHSNDGGITWSEVEPLTDTGYIRIVGVAPDGRALIGLMAADSKEERYFWEPGHAPATPPSQAEVFASPEILPDGRLVWGGRDAWYFDDGSSAGNRPSHQPGGFLSNTFPTYVDAQTGNFLAAYSTPPGVEDIALDLGKGIYIGILGANTVPGAPLDAGNVPALIDTTAPVIRPIASPFLDDDADHDFIYIAGAYPQATYVRVTGASPCAEVHVTPDSSSSVLGCLANDVLTIDLISSDKLVSDTPIPGWRDIMTLDHVHGYIESQYLAPQ